MFVCPRCYKSSIANPPWCHDVSCPAEQAEFTLDEGDRIMRMEIMRVVTRLPRATVYEVSYGRKTYLLKTVSQAGIPRLKRELAVWVNRKGFNNPQPIPLPPDLRQDHPYVGWMTTKHGKQGFSLFRYIEVESLPQYVARNQIMSEKQILALLHPIERELSQLHHQKVVHLSLTPATVLVPWQRQKEVIPFLIDLGVCAPLANAPSKRLPDVDFRYIFDRSLQVPTYEFETDVEGFRHLTQFCQPMLESSQ